MDNLTIGIDLGTTNSCVSYYYNGRVKIVENKEGDKTTPSFIFFPNPQSPVVGKNAMRMADTAPEFGIYEVKRLIGRKFSDSYVQNNLRSLPFKVEADSSNNPLIVLKHKTNTVKKTPQELCTIILQKLKGDVEEKFSTKVTKAVITVPAYFNVTQRDATLAAAKNADFSAVTLFNEPTAAALSHEHEFQFAEGTYSLVYDLGGGTFDVSVLKKSGGAIQVIGVDGDTQLGGHDFDNLIFNHVIDELATNYDYDATESTQEIRRIRNKCEQAKQMLSTCDEAPIDLVGLIPNHQIAFVTLKRQTFESLAKNLFQRTIDIVDRCLNNCKIDKNSIKDVILAGGSTRIPKIRQMVFDYFGGKIPNQLINADECVAEGAALRAAMLSTNPKQTIESINFREVVSLSLGLSDFVGRMNFIIRKNTPIPATGSDVFETCENDQDEMYFRIFEGERLDVRKNRFLGDITVSDITNAPMGQCKVIVCMDVDGNGILTVTAKEMIKNVVKKLTVNYDEEKTSESEIQEHIINAEQNRQEDKEFMAFTGAKDFLLRYCSAVIDNLQRQDLISKYSTAYKVCSDAKGLAEPFDVGHTNHVIGCIKQIRLYCEDIVKRHNFESMPTDLPYDDD